MPHYTAADTHPIFGALTAQPAIGTLLADWPRLAGDVLDDALAIQAIPAPTFAEGPRGEHVRAKFEALGLSDVTLDETGNVWARTPGAQPGLMAMMVSAHLDTVFPANTSLTARHDRKAGRIYAPGLGDNSLGLAGMIALAHQFHTRAIVPRSDIWWVATVGEEGLGDLRGMRYACDRIGDALGAVIVLEGLGLGRVYHAGLGVRRLRVEVSGPGGHSWLHSERPSAIHQLIVTGAALLDHIQTTESPKTSFNIGLIDGGDSINSRAHEASLSIDLRSEDPESLKTIENDVMSAIAQTPHHSMLRVTTRVIGDRPFGRLRADHPLVLAARAALDALHWGSVSLDSGSTDANIPLARGIPSICIGLTTGGNAHTLDEHVDTQPLSIGMRQLTLLALATAENMPQWAE